MISIENAVTKMISNCNGDLYDVNHFMKVWAYAKTIGQLEGLDERTQQTLELTAIVHDIACPGLREEYGSAPGHLQEQHGPALVREFYKDAEMDDEMLERIICPRKPSQNIKRMCLRRSPGSGFWMISTETRKNNTIRRAADVADSTWKLTLRS